MTIYSICTSIKLAKYKTLQCYIHSLYINVLCFLKNRITQSGSWDYLLSRTFLLKECDIKNRNKWNRTFKNKINKLTYANYLLHLYTLNPVCLILFLSLISFIKSSFSINLTHSIPKCNEMNIKAPQNNGWD